MTDLIYSTRPTDPAAFVAASFGVLIGSISSDKRVYQEEKYRWAFPISFIDNDFKKYDHDTHLTAIKHARPKYATVRDIMTREQCTDAGIEYYELAQILNWASEIAEYAENVIVIPKYDCLDKIPHEYMLGYSVETKYGGTPLPISSFAGRRIHLLGGSFRNQLEKIEEANGCVVSIDNNHITIGARHGQITTTSGKELYSNLVGKGHRSVCTLVSLSNMMLAINGTKQNNYTLPSLF